MTLPASQQRSETRIRVSRGLFAEAFRNVLYTPEGSAQAPKLIHQLVNGDDRGVVETALSGRTVLGGERLAAGFFLSVTCTEDMPYLSKDADVMAAGTFGGNYRLEQQRAACKEWPRGDRIERASTADEVGDPDAASLGRIRSGHAAVRRATKSRADFRGAGTS